MNPVEALTALFLGYTILALLIVALSIAYFVFWLLALVHCIQHRHDKDRLMWILVIIFVPFFGALFYMTMGRTTIPPTLPHEVAKLSIFTTLRPMDLSGTALDIDAMQDENKRAAAINEALSGVARSHRY